ncbi:homeobox protein aristaless-like [Orbicella faveolata]|uniref:homeobox protein aristaless-like n=1 Tax=Orbicella faveolata TaxID=48498 RepID=UPI0009E55CA0|nr:homeobox protein aristaless-like [Orbicella faveolata]
MESSYFKSVVSLVDSTHARKSRELSPSSPISTLPLATVFLPRKPTDFSISRILGLESDKTHKETVCSGSASVHCRHPIQTPSSQHSYSDTSPRLSPCSDNACSSSDCDSEPDQVSTHSEQPPRKKRQRTTFSPIEVWELERAYRRRPYLMSADEEDLVQRLGITAKSLKYWFQNRRAKSRKEEEKMTSRYQSSSSNQVGRLVREGVLPKRQQFRIQSPPDQWKHAECIRMSYPALENHLKVPPHSRPIRADNHYSSIKSNQLTGRSSLLVPMFHADQFKRRQARSARLSYSGGLHRYQPY